MSYNGNYMEDYDEQDFPGLFRSGVQTYPCHECEWEIEEGDEIAIEGLWDTEKYICEHCLDSIVNGQDVEPGDWERINDQRWKLVRKPEQKSVLFELFSEMFNPENNKI